MQIIVKGMSEDNLKALKTSDKKLAEEVILRDTEVDRLHWLIARQYHMILQNVSLAEKMNLTISLASTYFLISRIIERIGDHNVRIAQNIQNLKTNHQIIDKIEKASILSLDIFNKSISSFFRKDIRASNENIDSVEKLEKLCEELNTLALQQKGIIVISVGYIVESIRRIGEYAENICETAINYLVDEEK